jgi:integrase
VDARFLLALVAWLRAGGMKESSAATVLNTVSRLTRRWLAKGWIRKDPFLDDDFKSNRPKFTHRRRILSDTEYDSIVKHLRDKGHRDVADIVEVLRFTGLRLSEANALRVCDVNFEGREVRVRANGDFRPKTDSSARIVPVPASVVKLLRERTVRLGKRDEDRLFDFRRMPTHSPHVPIRQFRDACKALGLYSKNGENIGLHNLSHTRATELYNHPEVGLFSAMEMFGHVRTDTAKGYVHAASKEKHRAVEAVEAERERRRGKAAE